MPKFQHDLTPSKNNYRDMIKAKSKLVFANLLIKIDILFPFLLLFHLYLLYFFIFIIIFIIILSLLLLLFFIIIFNLLLINKNKYNQYK